MDQLISIIGVSDQFLLLPCFIAVPALNVNSVHPDQFLY